MEEIRIRKVTPADLSALQAIGRQTFSETFDAANTQDNMRRYLDESFSVEKLAAELTNPGSEFFFAELGGAVVGYLKLNTGAAQTELREADGMEIERIYVLKEYHRRKVGQVLYEEALRAARAQGMRYLWLGVWDGNERAIAFYQKNGFVPFDKHLFRLGNEEQTDILMKLELPR